MNSEEIRSRFLKFFEARGHKVVPSSSLVPEGDASVLFTTAGMQQFKPYYIGKKSPMSDLGSLNAVSVQKCVRTSDIEEVGDERHLTFFEMLGNFSFGGYWKREAIQYAYDFVAKEMNLKIDYITIFEGEEGVPADIESEEIWKSIDPNMVVKKFDRADNFWGPTGEEGPCGPTTEIYVDGIEIWNIVFNEFYQNKDKTLRPLQIKGIDTGMGLERLALVSQFSGKVGEKTVFDTDLLAPIILEINKFKKSEDEKGKKIIADHLRTAVFMIADDIEPSNTERGYILRRLIRRAIYYFDSLESNQISLVDLMDSIFGVYNNVYALDDSKDKIREIFNKEESQFRKTLISGKKQAEKFIQNAQKENREFISVEDVFMLYSTFGYPLELIREVVIQNGKNIDEDKFWEEFKKHQDISRQGSEQKFKGGLAGHSDIEIKYHTATHLLHQALRDVLGNSVEQKGSNITPERLRFDFVHSTKMTDEEKKMVGDMVNTKIKEALPMQNVVLPKAEAEKLGALHFFGDKYGDEVSVYYIGDSLETAYSKEFCGGPHVSNIGTLGTFKIIKEEAVSAGIRRIKAVLE